MRWRARLAVSPISEASSKRQGDGQRFQKKAMTTTKSKNEAAAPASVRPSESKSGTQTGTMVLRENAPVLPGLEVTKPFRFSSQPHEYKVTALRECPTPDQIQLCETPQQAADYWRLHVPTHPYFTPDCECFVVLVLNTRKRIKGHYLVSIGTMDTLLVHAREVFRLAIMTAAASIVLVHNLCVAAHKLCYVTRRVMCSCGLSGLTLTRESRQRECYVR